MSQIDSVRSSLFQAMMNERNARATLEVATKQADGLTNQLAALEQAERFAEAAREAAAKAAPGPSTGGDSAPTMPQPNAPPEGS